MRAHLLHMIFRITRPMTLGVRIVVRNKKQQVLLVRHGYIKGWHLPGGGVERGETVTQTVAKELLEETGIACLNEPKLFAIYANRKVTKRDHVLLYEIKEWERKNTFVPNWEIKETKFFSLDALPSDITQSTNDRLAEMFEDKAVSKYW